MKTSHFDQVADQVINNLVDETGETAYLARVIADDPTHHLIVEPVRATHVSFSSSEIIQLHATPSGLCILAYLTPAETTDISRGLSNAVRCIR